MTLLQAVTSFANFHPRDSTLEPHFRPPTTATATGPKSRHDTNFSSARPRPARPLPLRRFSFNSTPRFLSPSFHLFGLCRRSPLTPPVGWSPHDDPTPHPLPPFCSTPPRLFSHHFLLYNLATPPMPQLSRHDRVPALLSVIGGKRNPAYVAKTKRGREHDDNGDDLRDSLPFDAVNAEPQSSSESAGEDTDNNRTSTTGSAAGRQSRFKFPSFESGRTPSSSQLSSSTSSASDSRKRRRGPGLEKSLSCSSSTSVDAAPASSSAIWSDGPRKAGPNGVRKYGSRSVPPPASTSTSATGRTRPAGAPMRTLGQAAAAIASKDGAATITKSIQLPCAHCRLPLFLG